LIAGAGEIYIWEKPVALAVLDIMIIMQSAKDADFEPTMKIDAL